MSPSPADDASKVLKDDPLLKEVPEVEGYKVLEPCVLYAKVGEGGMGAVYRGRHLNLDIDVAIKCLKNVLAEQSPAFVTRFQREARIAASVHHQNLVQVYDISHKNGVHYLVMEFVRGETARERVTRKKRLSETEAVKVLVGAASGLAEAHGQRIVHRDIKPDNILISFDGKVKVSDLGLAKALELDGSPSLTMGVMGTPQYMAPEQWDDAATVGPAADVWALGATLYYLLTGEHAIPGGSMQQIYKKICVDPFPDIRQKLPSLSKEVKAVLDRCVQRDPKNRYADCRELLRELARLNLKDATAQLADAESGTLRVAPLLSPPPAETLGHIKVAIQGEDGSKVSSKPGSRPGSVKPTEPVARPGMEQATAPSPAVRAVPAPEKPPGAQKRWRVWAPAAAVPLLAVGWLTWPFFKSAFARPPEVVPPVVPPAPVLTLDVPSRTEKAEIQITGTLQNDEGPLTLVVTPPVPGIPAQIAVDRQGSFNQRVVLDDEGTYSIEVSTSKGLRERKQVVYELPKPILTLDALPASTSEAEITLSGRVQHSRGEVGQVTVSVAPPIDGFDGIVPLERDGTFRKRVRLPHGGFWTFTLYTVGLEKGVIKAVTYNEPSPVLNLDPLDTYVPGLELKLTGTITNRRGVVRLSVPSEMSAQGGDLEVDKASGSFSKTLRLPGEGTFAFAVESDGAERKDFSVTYDATPPQIEFTLPPDKQRDPGLRLVCTVTDAVSGVASVWVMAGDSRYDLTRDGASADSYATGVTLRDGPNELQLVAQDKAGKQKARPFSVTLDSTRPVLESLQAERQEPLSPGSNKFIFRFSEDIASLSINDEPMPLGEDKRNVAVSLMVPIGTPPDAAAGSGDTARFTLRWKAEDALGNPSEDSKEWEVRSQPTSPFGWEVDAAKGGVVLGEHGFVCRRHTELQTGIAFVLVESLELYFAETEVTVAQFKRWPSTKAPDDDLPVTGVSWKDANEYCKSFTFRLPTREEWLSACSPLLSSVVDDRSLYPKAWFNWPSRKGREGPPTAPRPVRGKEPNDHGLYDTYGNVFEWCQEVAGKRIKLGGSYGTPFEFITKDSGYQEVAGNGTPDTGFRPVKRIGDRPR
jgi:serine/threonine protein kinase